MTLLGMSPLLLLGLVGAAALVLFVLHLLVVRPREVRVPTLLFWLEAVEETRARTLIGRFRHPRTYAFLLLLAALLLAALADPEAEAAARETRHVVVMMDLSASLGVESGASGETRLGELQRVADDYLSRLPLRDRVALIGGEGGIIAGFDAPRPYLRERLAELEPRGGRVDLEGALREADTLLRRRHRPEILLFTDRELVPATSDGDRLASGTPLRIVRAGTPAADQGLGALAWVPGAGLQVQVIATAAVPERRLVVRPAREGRFQPLATLTVAAMEEAGSRWISVPDLPQDGSAVVVALEPPDALRANDRLRTWLPDAAAVPVFVDPELGSAVGRLVALDPGLGLASSADRARVALVAGPLAAQAMPTGSVFTAGPLGLWSPAVADLPPANRPLAGLGPPSEGGDPAAAIPLALGGEPVIRVGGGQPRRVEVAPWLLDSGAPWLRSAAGAALVLELCRRVGQGDFGPVVVPQGESMEIPVAATGGLSLGPKNRPALVEPAPRPSLRCAVEEATVLEGRGVRLRVAPYPAASLGGTGVAEPSPAPVAPPGHWRLWEWLVICALGLFLLDAWLHPQGRIP